MAATAATPVSSRIEGCVDSIPDLIVSHSPLLQKIAELRSLINHQAEIKATLAEKGNLKKYMESLQSSVEQDMLDAKKGEKINDYVLKLLGFESEKECDPLCLTQSLKFHENLTQLDKQYEVNPQGWMVLKGENTYNTYNLFLNTLGLLIKEHPTGKEVQKEGVALLVDGNLVLAKMSPHRFSLISVHDVQIVSGTSALIREVYDWTTGKFATLRLYNDARISGGNLPQALWDWQYEKRVLEIVNSEGMCPLMQSPHWEIFNIENKVTPNYPKKLIGSLQEKLRGDLLTKLNRGTVSKEDFFSIGFKMTAAIQHVFRKGIIHLDLSLQNWMFRTYEQSSICLIDFEGSCNENEEMRVPYITPSDTCYDDILLFAKVDPQKRKTIMRAQAIFALGNTFFKLLTFGNIPYKYEKRPFPIGSKIECDFPAIPVENHFEAATNILAKQGYQKDMIDLLKSMLDGNWEKRPSIDEVEKNWKKF